MKLQGKIPLRVAVKSALNFENVSKEISKYLQGMCKDLNQAVDSTLCSYTGFFQKIDCILHTCEHCGTEKLKETLMKVNQNKFEDKHKRLPIKGVDNKEQR